MSAPDTLSVEEAAQRLGISKAHAYRLARTHGKLCEGLPVIKLGSTLRVPVIPLERVLAGEAGAA